MRVSGRFDAFIVYLQPFSNTYGSIDRIMSVYESVVAIPGVVGLAVGTRPDCFTDELYDYLNDLAQRTYLSMEIGLQSSHDATLKKYNRGHTFDDFKRCIYTLSAIDTEIVAHVIIGLAPETDEMVMETAQILSRMPVTGVKIHQLMIIKGTDTEKWYEEDRIRTLAIDKYAELLCGFLSFLRPDQHIHRIMADSTFENGLVAPAWSAEKTKSVQFIHDYMKRNKTRQGSRFR
jgi:uncharacterized protein